MRAEALDRLRRIADLIRQRDEAALREVRARLDALARDIERLRIDPAVKGDDRLGPADRAGAAERWRAWRDGEIRRLQMRRATFAAEEERLRQVAARSVGRSEALHRLGPPSRK